ncbi:hypothetical protein [Candidatus Nitrosocosmicus arcticus]|uniref:hypothetical protein n=1 Tax=Candidatus Nitrosocosmicus arcticus TaxID=2035267 RepID=UPI0011A1BD18|nr:hypothetical protein [Candidatus Nitrosocosmicus arcticus]
MKNIYILQPFLLGSKDSKSLAIIIPSAITRKYHMDESSGLILRHSNSGIWLQYMDIEKKMILADQSFEACNQQVSVAKGEN